MPEHCQCPKTGYDHAAGTCPKWGQFRVRRGEVELLLCQDCTLSGDVRLDPEDA
jgi:hypothetical protein